MAELPTRAAFFDVDGTLTRHTTLFRFLRHEMASRGLPHQAYTERREPLRAMTLAGAPRAATNRAYFRLLAGREAAELAAAGRCWYRAERAGLFRPEALAALAAHREVGDLVVLVSGSFGAVLDPLAEELGADAVLCTRPEIRAGRYTGEVAHPMLGGRKALAAAELAIGRGIDPADCHAYGDHRSDLPLLRLVGHPVVVGEDERLLAAAAANGWPRLRPTHPASPTHPVPRASPAHPASPTHPVPPATPAPVLSATSTHGIGEAQ